MLLAHQIFLQQHDTFVHSKNKLIQIVQKLLLTNELPKIAVQWF